MQNRSQNQKQKQFYQRIYFDSLYENLDSPQILRIKLNLFQLDLLIITSNSFEYYRQYFSKDSLMNNKDLLIPLKTEKPHFYGQFVFVDSLTNRKIAIREMQKIGKRKDKAKYIKQRVSENSELKELNECIALLYSANAFKMKNLREKLFGTISVKASQQQKEGGELVRKKRLIRTLLRETIQNRNKQELHEYLESPFHKPNQQLLKVARCQNFPINKSKICQIMNVLEKKQNLPQFQRQSHKKNEEDHYSKNLNLLEQEMQRELKQRLRKTGQFLIEPTTNSLPRKNFNTHRIKKEGHFTNHIKQNVEQQKWHSASLDNSQVNFRACNYQRNTSRNKQVGKHHQLFQIIAKGEVEDMEVALGRFRKDALQVRDQNGNNLLHAAAKLKNSPIFELLVTKRGVQGLLQKNYDRQTPVEIASRLGYRQILKHVPRSLI